MKTHTAKVVKDSIENLGPNGMAFTVRCCDDPATDTRHTLHMAHTLTDAELRRVMEAHMKDSARHHLASEHNHDRVLAMIEGHPGCVVCGQ